VERLDYTFYYATSFNRDVSNWDVRNVNLYYFNYAFSNSGLENCNKRSIYESWSVQNTLINQRYPSWGDLTSENDACGVCEGDNSTCTDDCGVLNGDNSTCTDDCGVVNGDSSSCTDCNGVVHGTSENDACGVCGGDNSTCCTLSLNVMTLFFSLCVSCDSFD